MSPAAWNCTWHPLKYTANSNEYWSMLWFPVTYVPWDFLRWMWRSYGSHSQPQNCSHVVCPAFWSSQAKKLDETSRVSFHFPVQQRQFFPRRHMRCLIDSSFGHDPCRMKAEKHITSGCFCSNMNAGTLQTYQDIVKTSRLAARPPNIRRHSFMSPRGGSASSTWKWVWCRCLDTHTLKIFKALDGWTCSR